MVKYVYVFLNIWIYIYISFGNYGINYRGYVSFEEVNLFFFSQGDSDFQLSQVPFRNAPTPVGLDPVKLKSSQEDVAKIC